MSRVANTKQPNRWNTGWVWIGMMLLFCGEWLILRPVQAKESTLDLGSTAAGSAAAQSAPAPENPHSGELLAEGKEGPHSGLSGEGEEEDPHPALSQREREKEEEGEGRTSPLPVGEGGRRPGEGQDTLGSEGDEGEGKSPHAGLSGEGEEEDPHPALSQRERGKEEEGEEKLPAEQEETKPRGKLQGPRDLLALFGIDESHFNRLTDGEPLGLGEEELLVKLLFRSVEFPLEDLERWAYRSVVMEELSKDSRSRRGEVFWVLGRVQRMEVCRPLPEAARRFFIEQYYRCEMVLEEDQQPVVVYARTVPRAWLKRAPENERAGMLGFFLKTTSPDPRKPVPVFAGRRIAWYPDGLLGDLGMDVGLLDEVVDRQTLLAEERETFYQLLAAVRRARPGQVLQAAEAQARDQGVAADSVVPLFKEPAEHRGRLVLLTGAARKVVRVEVQDSDIRSRFGIDHYYEISLFTPDSQGNPLIVCVPSLPEGMPTGEGIQYVEEVRVAGFFLKSWSYRVPPPPDAPPEKRTDMVVWKKHAPLLVGATPVWYPREKPRSHPLVAAVAGVLFVLGGVGLWWAVWRAHRSDREFRQRYLEHLPPPPSLEQIGPPSESPGDIGPSDEAKSETDS